MAPPSEKRSYCVMLKSICSMLINDCVRHTILQKFTNFHAIRSWSFQNICNKTRWPRFFWATLYIFIHHNNDVTQKSSGFEFWPCVVSAYNVMQDIFIQSKVIDNFSKFKMTSFRKSRQPCTLYAAPINVSHVGLIHWKSKPMLDRVASNVTATEHIYLENWRASLTLLRVKGRLSVSLSRCLASLTSNYRQACA